MMVTRRVCGLMRFWGPIKLTAKAWLHTKNKNWECKQLNKLSCMYLIDLFYWQYIVVGLVRYLLWCTNYLVLRLCSCQIIKWPLSALRDYRIYLSSHHWTFKIIICRVFQQSLVCVKDFGRTILFPAKWLKCNIWVGGLIQATADWVTARQLSGGSKVWNWGIKISPRRRCVGGQNLPPVSSDTLGVRPIDFKHCSRLYQSRC